MKPNSKDSIVKIMAEVRDRTFIDNMDAKVLKKILQDSFNEYCRMLEEYYEEECYIAVSSARTIAYDAGHGDGYDDGYDAGCADCHAKYGY